MVSTFCFKIKCKRHRNTWQPRKEVAILNGTQCHSFLTTMKKALAIGQDSNQEDNTVEASWQSLKDALVEAEHGLPDLQSRYRIGSQKNLPTCRGKRVRHGCACAMLQRTITIFPSYSGSIRSCAAEPTEQLRRRGITGGVLRQQKRRNAQEWQNRMAVEDL